MENEQDEERCAVGMTLLIDALEFGSMTDAFRRGESLIGAASNPVAGHETYGVRRARPFARRRLRTRRPFFVFMRARKPCFFF